MLATNPPRPKDMSKTILGVLEEWGSIWMWSSLRRVGDGHWLEDAIEAGTCVAVTDDAYMCEVFPNVCIAAFILDCSEGRGRIVGSFLEHLSTPNAY